MKNLEILIMYKIENKLPISKKIQETWLVMESEDLEQLKAIM